MALKHRTFGEIPECLDPLKGVERAYRKWVGRREEYDLSKIGGRASVDVGNGRKVSLFRTEVDSRNCILIEDVVNFYRTRIFAVEGSPSQPGRALVEVHAPSHKVEYYPTLVSKFLADELVLMGSVGQSMYAGDPVIRKAHQVNDLLENVLNNPRRRESVIVAAMNPDHANHPRIQKMLRKRKEKVAEYCGKLHGVTSVYLLDAEASVTFNNLASPKYPVDHYGLRIFQPGFDSEAGDDARRHRRYRLEHLAEPEIRRVQDSLYFECIRAATGGTVDREFLDLLKTVEGKRRGTTTAGIGRTTATTVPLRTTCRSPLDVPRRIKEQSHGDGKGGDHLPRIIGARETGVAPSVVPSSCPEESKQSGAQPSSRKSGEAERIVDLMVEFSANLGIEDPGKDIEESVLQLLALAEGGSKVQGLTARIEELEREKAETYDFFDEVTGECDYYRELYEEISEQNNQLEEQLQERWEITGALHAKLQSGPFSSSLSERPAVKTPASMSKIIQYLQDGETFRHVRFTGDSGKATILDERKSARNIVRACWNFIKMLESYGRQYNSPGSVRSLYHYVNDTQRSVPPDRFAADETKAVKNNPKFSGPRMLPVPANVDPSGFVFMAAHGRLANDSGKAPRMHFFDNLQNDGKVYIGYIGEHLPSPMTN
ncbi:ABC transporter C-terminal domain-containing protein [Corynebacterium sp. CCM 9186]|uniref:ABC transporter C-terminal domain-containing protein n=1 Tax=Corynebacterium meridianum TaxID=2765363 RepID=UPI002006AF29|nr:ABC transporter C-terminal domain-containing protein [Corynebacterium meridianum]MCK7676977.1 ABC transporter C-terminal domain-containing protein [Corynebacterium meridianum]